MRGLDWQTIDVPFVGGLNTKVDPRALQPPGLAIANDVEFDELGAISLRHPFSSLSTSGLGSTVRRVYGNGDELLVFTQTELLSYSPSSTTQWKSRGTHLAIKVEEETSFATTGDQIDADRAELANCVVFAWTDNSKVYVAAKDKTTGATIVSPTIVNEANNHDRPRVVALGTKILVFFSASTAGSLKAIAIDPADPATGIASTPTTIVSAADTFFVYYDAVKIPGADTAFVVARLNPTTSHILAKVTSALAVTKSVKARTSDGPIAVSVDPTGATAQVVRANGVNIQGDRITVSSLADAATGQAIGSAAGTPVNQIACAHRSVQDSGQYRCYVFWSAQEAIDATDWRSEYNYVDTGGAIGTETTLLRRLGIASRAFDYNGRVFVWGVFAGESSFSGASPSTFRAQLQNTYFLYRDDATLHAKAAWQRGGGFAPSTGRLPHVALTAGNTTFSWCCGERRVIDTGAEQKAFGKRAPRNVNFTFDSNEARRVARLGNTLYVTGGEILQYDGAQLVECGFHVYPWYFGAIEVGAGNLADGTYTFKVTWRHENAKGELDRSTTATAGNVTIAAGPNGVSFVSWVPLYITHKTASALAVEVWRTEKNPADTDAEFFLVTSKDPAASSNPNRYIANDTTVSSLPTFNDEFADATLTTKEAHLENGGLLENMAPPAASIIVASDTRLFLAGVAGEPDRVVYSQLRREGQVAAFHETLFVDVPRDGGDITSLALLNETLIVFRERAVYSMPGVGFANEAGQGQNYGPPHALSLDVGAVSHEAVAVTPVGIVFKSVKGWYRLSPGGVVEYIGAPVADYDGEAVLAVHVVETKHQIRILTIARMLVFDYLVEQWAEWTISGGVHAALWNGTYTYCTPSAVRTERTDYSGVDYALDVETAWIKLAQLQGFAKVRWFEVLGAQAGNCLVKVRVARNYKEPSTDGYFDDKDLDRSAFSNQELQFRHTPTRPDCQAMKVRITALGTTSTKDSFATNGGVWLGVGPIATSGTAWTATLQARSVGPVGYTATFYACQGTGVEVRDDEYFDGTDWGSQHGNVGVRIGVGATVVDVERAINDTSRLIRVSSADVAPGKVITNIGNLYESNEFTGGALVAPSGDSIKLTALSIEYGAKRGLFNRLPASQQQ